MLSHGKSAKHAYCHRPNDRSLLKEDYLQFFDYTAFAVSEKVWIPVNRFNHTSWVAIVSPTDRPEPVCNRCVIDVLVDFGCFLYDRYFCICFYLEEGAKL